MTDSITEGLQAQVDKAKAFLDSFTGETAEDVSEAEEVISQTDALIDLFKHVHKGLESQNVAAELKLRLERKLGGLLGEPTPRGRPKKNEHRAHLPEGMDRHKAARYRKIAAIPFSEFENYLLATKHADLEITSAGALRLYAALNRKPKKDETVPEEVQPEPEPDEPVRLDFWKSANTCRDEVKRAARKLRDVKQVLSGLVESPYKPLLKKAAHNDPIVSLSWDGEEKERALVGATVVERVYTCPAVESLTKLVAGLELLLDREAARADAVGA